MIGFDLSVVFIRLIKSAIEKPTAYGSSPSPKAILIGTSSTGSEGGDGRRLLVGKSYYRQ